MNLRFKAVFLLFSVLVCSGNFAFCQKIFDVTIHIPEQLDLNKLSISYDNGRSTGIHFKAKNYTINIVDSFYGRYATILVYYPDSINKNNGTINFFWVSEHPSIIDFSANQISSIKTALGYCKLTNAFNVLDSGFRQLNMFTDREGSDFSNYLDSINSKDIDVSTNEAARSVLFEKGQRLRQKELDFMKLYPDLYYSIWHFRREVAATKYISTDPSLGKLKSILAEKMDKRESQAPSY